MDFVTIEKIIFKLLNYFLVFFFLFVVYRKNILNVIFSSRFLAYSSLEIFKKIFMLFFVGYVFTPYFKDLLDFSILENFYTNSHYVFVVLISLLLIDLFQYVLHFMQHNVPVLWRFHRLHHFDKTVDGLTNFLSHPIEGMISFILLSFFIAIIGIPIEGLFVYTILTVIHGPYGHSDIRFNEKFERVFNKIFITPQFHRVHHHLDMKRGNSNFGGLFPFWDMLFGTAVFPTKNKIFTNPTLGISVEQKPEYSILSFLINPFKRS